MCNRVSALFLNYDINENIINDEELEEAQCEDTNPVLYKISRLVGDIFEEKEEL